MNDGSLKQDWQRDLQDLADLLHFYELENLHFPLQEEALSHFDALEEQFVKLPPKKIITKKLKFTIIEPSKNTLPKDIDNENISSIRPSIERIKEAQQDLIYKAYKIAAKADCVPSLWIAMQSLEDFSLKIIKNSDCFFEGVPGKTLMFVEDSPTKEELRENRPFAGQAALLFEEMLFSIGLNRQDVYLANFLPWPNLTGRNLLTYETIILQLFLARHIVLASPKIIVPMGNIVSKILLSNKPLLSSYGNFYPYHAYDFSFMAPEDISLFQPAYTIQIMPTFSPYSLLNKIIQKKHSWKHLINLQKFLKKRQGL